MDLPALPDEFAATLARLDRLSRDHEVMFRLGVGGLILEDFFGGSPEAYSSHDGTKPLSFQAFLTQCRAQLEELGLSEAVLRRCVVARIVVDGLPPGVADRLRISHLTELAKVPDASTRAVLALASAENGWTKLQLRDAALAARAGQWIDGKPDVPGLQPPEPEPEPARKPQLGRVVTRYERAGADIKRLRREWADTTRKPTGAEMARMLTLIGEVEADMADLRKTLAG